MAHDPTRISRQLSYVLRHRPDSVGITLDGAGWVGVDTLLTALAQHGHAVSRLDLARVVAENDKRRFEVDGDRIRAAQGHSVPVNLGLDPTPPPAVLFHGTVDRFLPSILEHGLRPGGRRQVHLSADEQTARTVGARRGSPVILTVDAGGMHASGHRFYRAANGVWLTDDVPPQWIRAI